MEVVEEISIETPIKVKKPRSEKQIEAFQKAIAKRKEISATQACESYNGLTAVGW